MMSKSRQLLLASMTGLLLLAACGGSSDDGAGQLSSFQVNPDEVTLNSGDASCPGPDAKVADVAIIGGTAPYRVLSPEHGRITFGPAGSTAPTNTGTYTVANRNQQFAVFVTGCLDMSVTVLDDLGRVATVGVAAASGSGS